MTTLEILDRLLGFPTVSSASNLELIDWARSHLAAAGVASTVVPDATGRKAGLLATIGPSGPGGVLLSGHTDVVPVEGQAWTVPPFALTVRDGRAYGRGAADMKGFVACALGAATRAAGRRLRTPLHLVLSWDEELGCLGVPTLIARMEAAPRPAFCIVGEPTSMTIALGHKGKTALRATCTGREGHSAMAPLALNAIHLACDFVAAIRRRQEAIAATGIHDAGYDVPYTTLHVGRISGGTALNIVPSRCEITFEIRNLAADDPAVLISKLRADAEAIAVSARQRAPEACIEIEVTHAYPGLDTPADAPVVRLATALAGAVSTAKVAYGTEGGLFAQCLGIPVVISGPGDMAQGHRPDEFVALDQLARCDAMLGRLVDRLEAGL